MAATTLASLSPRRRLKPPAAVNLALELEHVSKRANGIVGQAFLGHRHHRLFSSFGWRCLQNDAGGESDGFIQAEELEGGPQRGEAPRRLCRLKIGVELTDRDLS
jgi:hypothetical protein